MTKFKALWVMLALSLFSISPAASADLLDATPRIAVMSAFEPEWVALKGGLADPEEFSVNGSTFVTGELRGKKVVLLLSGVSMVNAAMTTQQVIDRFDIKAIVFSGIAGGVDPDLNIGDVVVADQWAQYLEMVIAREEDGTFSPPPFIETPHPNYGMMFPKPVSVTRKDGTEPEDVFWFQTDAKLMETATEVAESLSLEDCVEENKCLTEPPKIVVGGNGVSGSAFVDNAAFRDYTFKTFKAKVLDMESAATAHVAFNNAIPFIAFRSLSDLAGGGEGANEMETFFGLASKNSAAVVTAFIEALPDDF